MKLFGIHTERRALLYLLGDLLIAVIAVGAGQLLRFGLDVWPVNLVDVIDERTGAVGLYLWTNLFWLYVFEAYDPTRSQRWPLEALRLCASVGLALSCQMALFYALPEWWWGRGVAFLTNASFAGLLISWRLLAWMVRPPLNTSVRTIILGDNKDGRLIAEQILSHPEQSMIYDLMGVVDDRPEVGPTDGEGMEGGGGLPVLAGTDQLQDTVRQNGIGSIIVAIRSGMRPELTAQLLECKATGVRIEDMRSVYRRMTGKVPIFQISDTSLIFGPEFSGTHGLWAAVQRVVDVVLALMGLALTWPVILLAGIAVKLETPGPAFYTQLRVGQNEEPFTIIKLRTMGLDAEARTGAVWSQGSADPRVTRVGRFLRRTRVDELPQLWNVVRGDMSMVGPRPERPIFVEKLKQRIPFYALRFSVKPGVTGWAQVKYRYGSSEEDAAEKLCYDLFAIQNLTPVLYLLIIVKTVQTVLMRPGS